MAHKRIRITQHQNLNGDDFVAIYRNVQLSFWTDNKVEDEFTPEDKYFYLYLLTNPQTNICGCYEVSYNLMSHQTGYNKDTIDRLLERFEKIHNIIRYSKDTREVLILNWYKYNWSKSGKVLIGVESVAKHIKNNEFREYIFKVVNNIRLDIPIVAQEYPLQKTIVVSDLCKKSDTVTDVSNIKKNDNKKRSTYKDILNNFLLEFNISEYLSEAINNWISYKKERNFTYKERGLKTFLKTVADKSTQFGDEAVVNAINESISSGYHGIVWDKIRQKKDSMTNTKTNQFNDFDQREYDYSNLESKLSQF